MYFSSKTFPHGLPSITDYKQLQYSQTELEINQTKRQLTTILQKHKAASMVISKASLIFKSNLELALSIVLKQNYMSQSTFWKNVNV